MQYLGMTNNHVKFVNLKEYNSWLDNLYLSQNEYKYLTHTYCIQIYYFIILSKIVSIFLQLTRNSKNLQNCDDDDDYWNSMVWKLSFCRFSLNASSRKERERGLCFWLSLKWTSLRKLHYLRIPLNACLDTNSNWQ